MLWAVHITSLQKKTRAQMAALKNFRHLDNLAYRTPEGDMLKAFALSESIHGQRMTVDDATKFVHLVLGKLLLVSLSIRATLSLPFPYHID